MQYPTFNTPLNHAEFLSREYFTTWTAGFGGLPGSPVSFTRDTPRSQDTLRTGPSTFVNLSAVRAIDLDGDDLDELLTSRGDTPVFARLGRAGMGVDLGNPS